MLYGFAPNQAVLKLTIACLNVHQGIYWVNSRFGTPITQILGLENVILQGRHHAFWFQRPEHNIWDFPTSIQPCR
jgi:hypothetical protein